MPQAATPRAESAEHVFPVPLEALDPQTLEIDLYLRHKGSNRPTLYRNAGLEFDAADIERLRGERVEFVYVPVRQHAAYSKALTQRLDRAFREGSPQDGAEIIRSACSRMIEDVLLFPGRNEPVSSIASISATFANWCAQDPAGFSYLMDMSAHDFYTTTHMVNVGVGCGMLAHQMHEGDGYLALIVQGGLLHDIGKRGVAAEVLNKEGKLSEEEWAQIRAHPESGFEELRGNPAVPGVVLEMVRDHHEKLDGSGYPGGRSAAEISPAARICAVVDVFDAITSARPYRKPTPPQDALEMMREGRGAQFDPEVFDTWAQLVEGLLEDDPGRAPPPTGGGLKGGLASLLPQDPAWTPQWSGRRRRELWHDERREHRRYMCTLPAHVVFHFQGKPSPVPAGTPVEVRVMDVSQGGARLLTPWPFTRDDCLKLSFDVQGERLERCARVVRVRQAREGWTAGVQFVSDRDAGRAN